MWTISNKQMEAMTESLVKKADEIKAYEANKEAAAANNTAKSDAQRSNATDNNDQVPESSPANSGANTEWATEPVLPCEQVEVVNLDCFEPSQLPQKEILRARWLSDGDVEIKSSLTGREVKIQVKTNGFPDGEKLNVQILDSKNKTMKSLKLTINGNEVTSDLFNVEDEWLEKILFINFES